MPNCCIPGCKNSSHRGYILKCFPKDEKRRAEWIKKINKPNWKPNNTHRVCEVHFAPEMWEKTRVDGTRKLKFQAVPTIFNDKISEKFSLARSTSPSISPSAMILSDIKEEINFESEEKKMFKNQTLIKISPPILKTNTSSPIVLPVCNILKAQSLNSTTGTILVNSKGQIESSTISGCSGNIKPIIKTTSAQSSPMLISTNANILKNQIKAANNQVPIIIPAANTSIIKPQVQTKNRLTNLVLIPLNVKTINESESGTPKSNITLKSITNVQKIMPKATLSMTQSVVESSIGESKETNSDENEDVYEETTNSNSIILNKTEAKKINEERFEKMDKLLLKQLKLNGALRKKLNLMNHKMNTLIKEQNNSYKTSILKDVFTEDQIRALEFRQINPKSVTPWSHKTMLKALKLKQECGTRGYQELLKQHLPLPSIRTLSRWCTAKKVPLP